jgi:hypothetical protein
MKRIQDDVQRFISGDEFQYEISIALQLLGLDQLTVPYFQNRLEIPGLLKVRHQFRCVAAFFQVSQFSQASENTTPSGAK